MGQSSVNDTDGAGVEELVFRAQEFQRDRPSRRVKQPLDSSYLRLIAESFPRELWIEIFSFLPIPDVIHGIRPVCTMWCRLVDSDYLWKAVLKRDVGILSPYATKSLASFWPKRSDAYRFWNRKEFARQYIERWQANQILNYPTIGKIALLGPLSVGKSSMMIRFARGLFDPGQEETIGATFMSAAVRIPPNRPIVPRKKRKRDEEGEDDIDPNFVKLEIWDIAGHERFFSMIPMYCRGAVVVILVFDVTSRESFTKLDDFVDIAKASQMNPTFRKFLVGNKTDLKGEREVPTDEAVSYAKKIMAEYCECSAKTGEGIQGCFRLIARRVQDANIEEDEQEEEKEEVEVEEQ